MHIIIGLVVLYFLITHAKEVGLGLFWGIVILAGIGLVWGAGWVLFTYWIPVLIIVAIGIALLWGLGVKERLELKKEYETLNSYDIKTKEENERLQKIAPAATGSSFFFVFWWTEESDIDGDGIADSKDNDMDGDGVANDEDIDMDGDGVIDPDVEIADVGLEDALDPDDLLDLV
jgi:hypothetical protein